ncbi:MAG: DNA primase [Candidatus Methylomirabilis oxygeniifera]|uniref:DNA primase n=1 Tax=Methylomirabilis oxygeniifera TaxID=671143 RepID=D5MKY9_METO1|nr:MAG: DNA primase [Candidatus Methylomirabilis oxyfera]CBE69829.1 putative DNA primase [Candidatus Methylomirabilis oxyfera]
MACPWAERHEKDERTVIAEEAVSRVLAGTDIVQLIGRYLPLKPAGRYFKALCPFHNEKTPSFTVNPERQIFHCFGCGEGGDAIGFLMKQEHLSFPEAIRSLADRAGISLPAQSRTHAGSGTGQNEHARHGLLEIHKVAAEFFRHQLQHQTVGTTARAYLRSRGIPDTVVEQFGLGYATASWDGLLRHLLRRGFSKQQVEEAGLALLRKDGSGAYDRFRNRLMIPICDSSGQVIAFGGRVMDDSAPKYLNSPETAIYKKGAHLFGLHLAASAIRDRGSAVVVEGYFDLIALHASGVQHTVAVLGTALTAQQITLLHRHTTRAFLVFDPDPAGIAAARRCVESLLNSGLDWRVILLPDGEDPDRFLRERGPSAFAEALAQSKDLMEFLLDRKVSGFDLTSPEGQAEAVNAVLPLLGAVGNEVTRQHYADKLARRVSLSNDAIVRELNRQVRGRKRDTIPLTLQPRGLPSIEWKLLHLALHHPGAADRVRKRVRPEELEDRSLRRIFQYAVVGQETGRGATPLAAIEPEAQRILTQLLATDLAEYDGEEAVERALSDCLARLTARRERKKGEELRRQMEAAERAGDHAMVAHLQAEFLALNRNRPPLASTQYHGTAR